MKHIILPVFILGLLGGCGSSDKIQAPDMGGADGSQVASVLEELNDAVSMPKKFDAIFAKGAKPSDTKKYAKYSYSIIGKPSVSGNTATCQVRIDTTTGEKAGELEWSFEKEVDKWKIKNAPLP